MLAKAVVLTARTVPTKGGETVFADMRAAYAALHPVRRSEIDALDAVHDYGWSHGFTSADLRQAESHVPPITQPLVDTHPDTKQPSLLIGRHIRSIVGMSPSAGRALAADLLEQSTQPPRTVRHRWAQGDLVVWDNRPVLHRVRPWPSIQVREMARTTVAGDGPNPWVLS